MKQKLVRSAKVLINRLGYHIDKIDRNSLTMASGLERSAKHVTPQSFIDVGASDGRWTELAKQFFPNSHYLLIEAQEGHRKDLEHFQSKHQHISLCMAAAGDTEGEIYFDASDLHAGLASKEKLEKNCITVPVTTIDVQVEKHKLIPPFCIKLDTHGFEIPILEGANKTLENADMLIIEAYNFQIVKNEEDSSQNSLRFYQLCQYLDEKGFYPADIVDIMRRKKDDMLWQMDMFFYRKENKVFKSNSYE